MSGANQGPTVVTDVPGHGTITTNSSGFGSADQGKAQSPSFDPFLARRIDVQFGLGRGDFGEAGSDTVTIKGLRIQASIQKFGVSAMNTAQIRISGLELDLINRLSTLGIPKLADTRKNTVTLLAGDSDTPPSMVFQGIVWEAYPDTASMPDVTFVVQSQTGIIDQLKPVEPTSYPGSADAVVMMQQAAQKMGLQFENAGVPPTMLENQYLAGTAFTQVDQIAEAAHIAYTIDNGKLVILPIYGFRQGKVPVISPATGMVGYPAFHSEAHIRVTTLFNREIEFLGRVKIEGSELTNANGIWRVMELQYELESELPHGQWFTVCGVDKIDVNA